ncbi:ComEC/Rec2 family competence protein [Paracoccus sp. IB05]|uniref:ComEC/Rec2 family competence protein n=1 Tax=Paracoccus sp. IB05 TaxID=2779367 RepID=UPI0018E80156|nr:ComEC/Rec2 family competence protein [Paracoccus sp. IB05]
MADSIAATGAGEAVPGGADHPAALSRQLWRHLARFCRGPIRALIGPLIALEDARGHLLPLAVILFGSGIGLWFALETEPGALVYGALVALAVLAAVAAQLAPFPFRSIGGAVLALSLGLLAAGLRAHMIAAPMLDFGYYGPVEGRVVEIDTSASDAVRITLDQVVLERTDPARVPHRVRVALHGNDYGHSPAAGETVILTGHLSAPQDAAEPGGFDFRRMAFFQGLGAVGYSQTPVLLLEPPRDGEEWIGRLRAWFSSGIRAHIPGEAGAFAAGAMTGDRSGISQKTVEDLRDSSLAHILAISGMNLVCLTAFVFALLRGGIACFPWLALRVNAKKLAALVSIFVAWFYLQLSGANVATERAFVMTLVMLLAILMNRRAMTIRSAAIAGAVLLALKPESLLAPGFQMSMAATISLIAGFQAMDRWLQRGRLARWQLVLITVVMSSVIGGFATAPYAAAHFNRFADYGLMANILTAPAMGIAIMPMGVLAFLLAPVGLEALPLWVMGKASEWILWVAAWVAGLDGSVTAIPAPHWLALPVISWGGLWLIAWPGRARLAGVGLIALGIMLWPLADRPELLISADGRLVGVMGPEGRALSTATGGGFSASNWLESDGDLASQKTAALRPGFTGTRDAKTFEFSGRKGVAISGKAGLSQLAAACAGFDLVILNARAEHPPPNCPLIDQHLLSRTGAIALRRQGAQIEATFSARDRIWSSGSEKTSSHGVEAMDRLDRLFRQGASP